MAVILMRGVSGAGKSTWINNLKKTNPGVVVVSADHFFLDSNNNYNFDPAKLSEAHGACLRTFISFALGNPDQTIVVDNTNTTPAECAPYMAIAAAYYHMAEIITLDCPPEVAASRNVHGVPLKTVIAQHERLTRGAKGFPPYWKHTVLPAFVPLPDTASAGSVIPDPFDSPVGNTVVGEWG